MANPVTVVVLGGGIGGVVAARRLRELLDADARVVLVEREPLQSFPPSYTWVMTGKRRPEAITRDLRRLRRKGIEVLEGSVETIDFDARRVSVADVEITYDYLVIALGAELAPESIEGLKAQAFGYYQLAEAERLHRELAGFTGGRVALLITSLPYKCPAAPYEGALLLDALFRKRGIRDRVDISLSTPEPQPLPVAGPALGAAVSEMLRQKDIAYFPGRKTTKVDELAHEVVFEDGAREKFDLLIAVPPHRPPPVVRESPIAGPTGWASVDARTMATPTDRVYAIGDATAIPLPDGMALPKAGVFAHRQAEVVARNIAAQIKGSAKRTGFNGNGFCFLESGEGAVAMARGNFYGSPRDIRFAKPAPWWGLGKLAFEWWWLHRWY
jgi:sulfide:quinone oxidoreductase